MAKDIVHPGSNEAVEGISEEDILSEIAAWYAPNDVQIDGDIPLSRIMPHRLAGDILKMVQAKPYPGYDLLQVRGRNGRRAWVLRKKITPDAR